MQDSEQISPHTQYTLDIHLENLYIFNILQLSCQVTEKMRYAVVQSLTIYLNSSGL